MKKNSGLEIDLSQVTHFHIDSRWIGLKGLFFAIRGKTVDGHDFLTEVAQKGAFGAVVSKDYLGPSYGLNLFYVDQVDEALREMARASLKNANVPVIGITGSVGKTTTKDFIATLLEGTFRVWKTEHSENSKLTLPLTVLNRPDSTEVLVLEMGMSEPGDIQRLVSIAPPKIAVLTKVALVHAENFSGGLEEIEKEKKEIFSHQDTEHFVSNSVPGHLPFSADDLDSFVEIPFDEEPFLYNLSAAVRVAKIMGLSQREIQSQIPKLTLPKMRFERIEKKGVLFINDAYNAGPESMKAALKSLKKIPCKGKKIAVLGEMKELGIFCEPSHKEVGAFASKTVDVLLAYQSRVLFEAFHQSNKRGEFFSEKELLTKRLKEIVKEGDVVLIKGSRALKMETMIECFSGS